MRLPAAYVSDRRFTRSIHSPLILSRAVSRCLDCSGLDWITAGVRTWGCFACAMWASGLRHAHAWCGEGTWAPIGLGAGRRAQPIKGQEGVGQRTQQRVHTQASCAGGLAPGPSSLPRTSLPWEARRSFTHAAKSRPCVVVLENLQ